ncbi:MAG TPA: hypothetical protein VK020_16320 [Microlunatus sp.]|nr:hypothetical protein [Microlunatus sp.]
MDISTTPRSRTDRFPVRPLALILTRWPSLVGLIALVASSAGGLAPGTTAMIITLAALCYLVAAAVGRRAAAWIAVPALGAVVLGAGVLGLDPVPMLVITAVPVAGAGLVRAGRAERTGRREVLRQAAAFAAFAGVALVALSLDPLPAAHLAALLTVGHAVWDLVHHRRDRGVSRSLTEFCAVLDLGLGVVTLGAAWLGHLG